MRWTRLFLAVSTGLALPAAAQAPNLEDHLAQARAAFEKADYATAETHYRRALPELQRSPSLFLRLAEAVARQGFEAEGLTWLERAAAFGIGADRKSLEAAFGTARDAARWQAVLARFARNREPLARGQVAFTLAERDLIPESLAFDPADGAFYVGSLRKRKIVRVARDGRVSDLVPTARDGLFAVLGIKLDPARRELWANACSLSSSPPMAPPDRKTDGQAALFRYSLPDGRLLGRYAVPDARRPLCFNDLVLTADGSVFLSSGPDGIFRLASGAGAIERLVTYDGFVNGIAASDDGRFLFLADHRRGVVRLELATRALVPLALPAGETLAGIDGLYVRGRTLVAIQNGLASGPERVLQAWLDEALGRASCVALLDRDHPAFDIPTTGALVGEDLYYVASSQLRRFTPKGQILPWNQLAESTVLRTPLLSSCPSSSLPAAEHARAELLAAHQSDRWAHFQRDVDLLLDGQAPVFISASRGELFRASLADTRSRFDRMFSAARYLEWDDLEPPVITVSDDGTLGTTLVRIRVRRLENPGAPEAKETTFEYAGTMIYERQDGRFVRTQNASTFREP
jgi:hypothetical protein